jgi:hypothetical protein
VTRGWLTHRCGPPCGGRADAFNFLGLRLIETSLQMSAPTMITIAKKRRNRELAGIVSLLCAAAFVLLISGCADTYYTDVSRTPEARYNTYYAPYYYPYYPWYSYYGGAYYYGD